ncbi:MAG: hypothetical protein AB3N11_04255 [Arenibacterium sp.]
MQPVSSTSQVSIPPQPRGNSAVAVGQVAKQIVRDATAAGVDLPKNPQGVAASAVARGADPASVFAAQVAEEIPTDPPAPTADGAISAFEFNAPAIQTEPLDPAETALRVLEE